MAHTGAVAHADILQYYGLIDVFVVPRTADSISQNVTPLKPLEAMATGRALVVTDVPALKENVGWPDLRAVRENQVFVADGNQYFNRPGSRIVESLEILAEMLHPDAFHFGHEGAGWRRI